MFTGLIEGVGRVSATAPMAGGFAMFVATPLAGELAAGDSLAVNGVCLTVVPDTAEAVRLEVSPETVRVTTLGDLRPGDDVNLERPLRADARLGGHFVQGHVDATGTITELRPDGDSYWLTVAFPDTLAASIVPKGSIAVDGISLTVARLDARSFGVQIIPYTWTHTNLRSRGAGARVNLEADVLGKYVARAIDVRLAAAGMPGALSREDR